jgi:hypothetical protein
MFVLEEGKKKVFTIPGFLDLFFFAIHLKVAHIVHVEPLSLNHSTTKMNRARLNLGSRKSDYQNSKSVRSSRVYLTLLLLVSAWRDRYAASKGDIAINTHTNILFVELK